MSKTWWVSKADLDKEQREVYSLPDDKSYLVLGPPGSGKTNLLLLRANYLHLAGAGTSNLQVVVFTRMLRDFISSGGARYDFPSEKVVTLMEWQHRFLLEHGGRPKNVPDEFDRARAYLTDQVLDVIEKRRLKSLYDAFLLDEAQDFTPKEIEVFRRLAQRLFCVADSRQKIYDVADSMTAIESVVDDVLRLRAHYRNGEKICRLADAIAKGGDGYEPLLTTCNYNEGENPSTVAHHRCKNVQETSRLILARLPDQITTFPGELFGVLCPTQSAFDAMRSAILASPLREQAVFQSTDERIEFTADRPICVCKFHGAKGLEFRGVHMVECNQLKRFGHNRNMAYTAATRAKTALDLYYSAPIHPYLESALAQFDPPRRRPTLDDVFGGASR